MRNKKLVLLVAALIVGGLGGGCDQVEPRETGRAPSVSELSVTPDSVNAGDVPPDRVQDSVAQVPLELAATVEDPDGTIERVVFTIEPSSNPRGTLSGQLAQEQGARYRRQVGLGIPILRDEVFTIRVFAVDNDSLTSNQGIGHFRFVSE